MVFILEPAACASSLDMSTERIAAPAPNGGLVIGSVLVRSTQETSAGGRATTEQATMYEFDVVQTQPRDPNGESPYVPVTSWKPEPAGTPIPRPASPGQYLMKRFYRTGLSGTGETLNLVFESQSGRVVYGLKACSLVPAQLTKEKNIAFPCRTPTRPLSHNSPQHSHPTQQAVTALCDSPGREPMTGWEQYVCSVSSPAPTCAPTTLNYRMSNATHVLIIHEVEAYPAWKVVFDGTADIRKHAGEIRVPTSPA